MQNQAHRSSIQNSQDKKFYLATQVEDSPRVEAQNRVKRSSSLSKLTRNLNHLITRRSSSGSKVRVKNLLELHQCEVVSLVAEEDKMKNAAPTMLHEPEDDPSTQRNVNAIKIYSLELKHNPSSTMAQEAEDDPRAQLKVNTAKIYSFESKYNPIAPPNQMATPLIVEQKEVQKRVIIHMQSQEKFCRFCFESEETKESGQLIYPCRCDGSLKHIHENCLKTWIVQRHALDDLEEPAKCEICSYSYHLEVKSALKFNCDRSFNQGFSNLLIGTGLTVCLGNLLWIMIKYIPFFLSEPSHTPLLAVFTFLAITFLIPIVVVLRRACFGMKVVEVKVHNFDPDYQHPEPKRHELPRAESNDLFAGNLTEESERENAGSQQEANQNQRQRREDVSQNLSLNMSQHQLLQISVI